MGRVMHFIPKNFRYPLIKELEEYGLLRKINKLRYAITGGAIDSKLTKYDYPFW
jgi:hypothetical protein